MRELREVISPAQSSCVSDGSETKSPEMTDHLEQDLAGSHKADLPGPVLSVHTTHLQLGRTD